MKAFKLFILSVITVGVSACVTFNIAEIPNELAPVANEREAYLIGTIGVQTEGDESSPIGLYSLLFRAAGGSHSGSITFRQVDFTHTPVVYRTSDGIGGVFVVALRPGNYEFHNVRFYYHIGLGHQTISAKRNFSIPFTLRPGRALYIGELTARATWSRGLLQYVPIGGYFFRSNKFDRDKTLIRSGAPGDQGCSDRYSTA